MSLDLEDLRNQIEQTDMPEYHLHAIGWVSGQHSDNCLPSPVRATVIVSPLLPPPEPPMPFPLPPGDDEEDDDF